MALREAAQRVAAEVAEAQRCEPGWLRKSNGADEAAAVQEASNVASDDGGPEELAYLERNAERARAYLEADELEREGLDYAAWHERPGLDYEPWHDCDDDHGDWSGKDEAAAAKRWANFRKVARRASSRGCGANNHGNRDGVPYEPNRPYMGTPCTCWKYPWDHDVDHAATSYDPRLHLSYKDFAGTVVGGLVDPENARWAEHPGKLVALVDAELKRRHDPKCWSTKAEGHCFSDDDDDCFYDDDSDDDGGGDGVLEYAAWLFSGDGGGGEGCLDETD